MKDRLQLILYYKNMFTKLETIVINTDNRYKVLKTKILEEFYEILELIYFVNRLEVRKRKYYQNKILAKISLLDYLFFQLYQKKQISIDKYNHISSQFLSFTKQVIGWMKYENNL